MRRAWYLGHSADEVGDRAILIGDPDRVNRISALLDEPHFLPVSRGLKTVTGGYRGRTVTVAAFGMGAPIATIVLHELAELGIRQFLRIGTAMYFPPAGAGDFLISNSAIAFEGTSASYADGGGPFDAAPDLVAHIERVVASARLTAMSGLYATFDAFYRDMFGTDDVGRRRADANRKTLASNGVLAVDMETSALLAAAAALDVGCATICLGTVDALTQEKLPREALQAGETQLFEIALAGLCAG